MRHMTQPLPSADTVAAVERVGVGAADSVPAPSGPRRGSRPRSRSIRVVRVTRRESRLAAERADELEAKIVRPHRREECRDGPRPCPHVSCRHHLYLDVNPATGTIKLNFPELEVWELAVSCTLDVAENGGSAIEAIGQLMNVTRERVRQIEAQALAKLVAVAEARSLRDH
jgi:hypothetical protein